MPSAFGATKRYGCPTAMDFDAIPGLSNELRAKLQTVRPQTLGHANRIEGMTPAALGLLCAPCSPQGWMIDPKILEADREARASNHTRFT